MDDWVAGRGEELMVWGYSWGQTTIQTDSSRDGSCQERQIDMVFTRQEGGNVCEVRPLTAPWIVRSLSVGVGEHRLVLVL